MKFRRQAISLSLLLSLSLGTVLPKAHASMVLPGFGLKMPLDLQFTTTLKKLYLMDATAEKKLFDVRNAKGESIFKAPVTMQKDLWATLDPVKDSAEGTSTEKVYQNFKISADKNEVIVAVIDSGVDINHEDLKGHIWVNTAELFGKPGVDDDGDGYVDDIYGWNFLGNKNGQNVAGTTLEITRILNKLTARMNAGEVLNAEEQALFQEVSKKVSDGITENQQNLDTYSTLLAAIDLLKANGLKTETVAGLAAVTANTPEILKAKALATRVFNAGKDSSDLKDGITHFKTALEFNFSTSFNSSDIVQDDPNVLDEKGYGNNDVFGPTADHGTHVSGIIAAVRNQIGIDGQGKNIKIMPIRAIPDGDERDKDVGNAIRFAVDHGARIINMSFGKEYSPNKDYVDQAMKYAESKGVLLVHAAGNDGKSTESLANNYPNRRVSTGSGTNRLIESWIEVGASSKIKGATLPAEFSNYGKTAVDVFAPGVDIVSTIPGNKYASFSGTSMASPETAGVAALLLEVYPNATALELKGAILNSTNQYPGLMVNQPTDSEATVPVLFSELSATGGTVNAYQAMLEMAKQTVR